MGRFVFNRNFDKELAREFGYKQAVAAAVKPAEEAAKRFAPVRSGDYRDSIGIAVDGDEIRLEATDFKAHWIEWGTVKQPPVAPLRRGVRSAGLKFTAEQ